MFVNSRPGYAPLVVEDKIITIYRDEDPIIKIWHYLDSDIRLAEELNFTPEQAEGPAQNDRSSAQNQAIGGSIVEASRDFFASTLGTWITSHNQREPATGVPQEMS